MTDLQRQQAAAILPHLRKILKVSEQIVFFDLETTSTDVQTARIVQFGAVVLEPDNQVRFIEHLIYPGIPIPPEATEVHGITDAAVAKAQKFIDYAPEIRQLFDGAIVAGFNVEAFDLPILSNEFARIGAPELKWKEPVIDVMRFYHRMNPRTLSAAFAQYTQEEPENAHSATYDSFMTARVLCEMLEKHTEAPVTLEELDKLINPRDPRNVDRDGKIRLNDQGEMILNFGKKHPGKRLSEIVNEDPGYLDWILLGNFSEEVKCAVRKAIKRI